MDTFDEGMDLAWSQSLEEKYRILSPHKALSIFTMLAERDGEKAINEYPERDRLFHSMARVEHKDLVRWAHETASDDEPETFQVRYARMLSCCNECRRLLKLEPMRIMENYFFYFILILLTL